jgi:hypothetical protein
MQVLLFLQPPGSPMRSRLLLCFPALASFLVVGGSAAQEPKSPSELDSHRWSAEYQDITRQLSEIEAKALQNPALQHANEILGAQMTAALERADPLLPAALQRIPAMEAEARRAEQRGDYGALRMLGEEIRAIEARYRKAQASALRSQELADRVQLFQELLQNEMRRVEPAADSLLTRFQQLHIRLAEQNDDAEPR